MEYNNAMLQKSDLKVIKGGALSQRLPDEKFISAYATNTRLMGVLVPSFTVEKESKARKC